MPATEPRPLDPEQEQWDRMVGEFEKKRAELWKTLEREDVRLVREYREWRRRLQETHGVNEHTRRQMDVAWTDLCKERKAREKAHWDARQKLEKELDMEFEAWTRAYCAAKRSSV